MINFSEKYDRKNFQHFLEEFLPKDLFEKNEELQVDENNEYFKKAILLGSVKSLEDLVIIEVERKRSEKSRITITKELFKFLSTYGYSKALIVTFSEKESHYRFSLITSDLNWVGTKVNKEFSNPKRLSFLLGEESKIHTATKYLVKQGKVKNFEDLYSRFNIEIINNDFFDHYKNLYLNLKNRLDKDKEFSLFAKKFNLKTGNFAKKLLGQIVFCYFLQKKGWLGVDKNKPFGTGGISFLRDKFEQYKKNKENFFNNFLEFFFYKGLNSQNENDFVKEINCKVPYIGGGLFEYNEGYDWKKETLNIPNTNFSNSNHDGILDIFDLYNFTVDENENIDVEISIDPEMLGRVFENLLEENIRKSGGSYYTPRTIVNYMCNSSLIYHLNNKLADKINLKLIKRFVKDNSFEISKEKIFQNNAEAIDNILQNVKICDPAIGSGAFAVGIVNLIAKLRNSLKGFVKRKYKNNSYYFKRDCIQNSIYGIDFDSSAVEITKLRLWLSLIVDEEDYSKTEPLPNLDFQILQGNSIINEVDGYDFQHLDVQKEDYQFELLPDNTWQDFSKVKNNLIELKKKFFNIKNFKLKSDCKKDIEKTLIKLTELALSLGGTWNNEINLNNIKFNKINSYKKFFLWKLYFIEIFQDHPGFDIVIANPPYIKERDNKEIFLEVSKTKWGKKFHQGKMDYWYFFLNLSIDIAKKDGVVNFITSKYWVNSSGASKLVNRVKDNLRFLEVIDIGKLKVFQNVAGHHMIHTYKKTNDVDYNFLYKKLSDNLDGLDEKYNDTEFLTKNSKDIFLSKNEINFRDSFIKIYDFQKLDDIVFSSQGLVQNPDKVNKSNAEKYSLNQGEGVFVLSDKEISLLNLSTEEQKFVKPFYEEKDIKNLSLNKKNRKNLLYITSKNCKSISGYKNLHKHLSRFKKITQSRRENILKRIKFFHLHWPRREDFFLQEKIIIPSMNKNFDLAYCNYPAYFGLGANILIKKDNNFPIKYVFSILASSFARYWLETNAKERGAGFDFSLKKIKDFPIKKSKNVDKFIKNFDENEKNVDKFREINNKLVFELYNIDINQQSLVHSIHKK